MHRKAIKKWIDGKGYESQLSDWKCVFSWYPVRNPAIALIVYERINFNFFFLRASDGKEETKRKIGKIGCVRSEDEIGFDAVFMDFKVVGFSPPGSERRWFKHVNPFYMHMALLNVKFEEGVSVDLTSVAHFAFFPFSQTLSLPIHFNQYLKLKIIKTERETGKYFFYCFDSHEREHFFKTFYTFSLRFEISFRFPTFFLRFNNIFRYKKTSERDMAVRKKLSYLSSSSPQSRYCHIFFDHKVTPTSAVCAAALHMFDAAAPVDLTIWMKCLLEKESGRSVSRGLSTPRNDTLARDERRIGLLNTGKSVVRVTTDWGFEMFNTESAIGRQDRDDTIMESHTRCSGAKMANSEAWPRVRAEQREKFIVGNLLW